jgi:phosphoribosylformimino-5-aminoimidazole carboxamide ribotide isomerase
VNLDGAFGRESRNFEIVRSIVAFVDARVQFGGGLRSRAAVQQALEAGCDKVVLGTAAVSDSQLLKEALQEHGSDHIIVALDASHGKVATHGWQTVSEENVVDLAGRMYEFGVRQVLYTDISRDGMMTGPDLSTLVALCSTGLYVIASGGISSSEDIRSIAALHQPLITGVIVGKALYEKRVSFRELLDVLISR